MLLPDIEETLLLFFVFYLVCLIYLCFVSVEDEHKKKKVPRNAAVCCFCLFIYLFNITDLKYITQNFSFY